MRWLRVLGLCFGVLLLALPVAGLSGTTCVVREGTPIGQEKADFNEWPDGLLELLNDPARTSGWNFWFSDLPSDVEYYGFRLGTTEDVARVVELLSRVRGGTVRLLLDPRAGSRGFGFSTQLSAGDGLAATFSVGNQGRMYQWYQRLPVVDERGQKRSFADQLLFPPRIDKPRIRKHGVHRYTECPTAMPPTLTLYTGHPAVDIDRLDVPVKIEVLSGVSKRYREERAGDPAISAIERFISEHDRKRENESSDRDR